MNLTEVKVSLIDLDKLNENLNHMATEYMVSEGKSCANKSYSLRTGDLGIITASNGTVIVVDNELVGDIITESKYDLAIYENSIKAGKITGFGMFPVLNTAIDLNELIKGYTLEDTIDVVEFMGTRYDYNDRVRSNQREFKNWLNENK